MTNFFNWLHDSEIFEFLEIFMQPKLSKDLLYAMTISKQG